MTLTRAIVPLTKTSSHNHNREKRLPKYDSQSEKTIDSCPWLKTIPGQNIEMQKNIENNIECPPKSHPDQTKYRHKEAL
jgi:hypothetical protein